MALTEVVVALVVCLGCQAADGWSTVRALRGGAREANPLVRRLGLVPAKLLGALLCSLPVLGGVRGGLLWGYLFVLVLWHLWLVRHNLRQGRPSVRRD